MQIFPEATRKQIAKEVGEYPKTPFFTSLRGTAVLIYIGRIVVTVVLLAFMADGELPVVGSDVILTVALAIPFFIFIYLRHRWAMAGFIAFTTFDQIVMFALAGFSLLGLVLWGYTVYALSAAIVVENTHRKSLKLETQQSDTATSDNATPTQPNGNFCPNCGAARTEGAKFCPGCGQRL